jgi:hypothetical protein
MNRNDLDPLLREFLELFELWFHGEINERKLQKAMSPELWEAWLSMKPKKHSKAAKAKFTITDLTLTEHKRGH